jgi:hypothetical protein
MDYVIITPENCKDIYGVLEHCGDIDLQYIYGIIKI